MTYEVDLVRIRTDYLRSLAKLYNSVNELIASNGTAKEVKELLNQVDARYQRYLESHKICMATISNINGLKASHDHAEAEYYQVYQVLKSHVSCVSNTSSKITSLSSSQRNSKPKYQAASRSCSKKTSQVSRTNREKLIEAKVQAEIAKKRIEELKAIQEKGLQRFDLELRSLKKQQELKDEKELQETLRKLNDFDPEPMTQFNSGRPEKAVFDRSMKN